MQFTDCSIQTRTVYGSQSHVLFVNYIYDKSTSSPQRRQSYCVEQKMHEALELFRFSSFEIEHNTSGLSIVQQAMFINLCNFD